MMNRLHALISIILIASILVVAMMGEGTLQATAMAGLTTALGGAINWLFGSGDRRR
jgi:hypothetical protein